MTKDVVSVLQSLVAEAEIEGVEVLRRDGQCLHEVFRPELGIPEYSSDSAVLTAASEDALPQLRFSRDGSVVTRAADKKVVVVRADDDLVLAALASADRRTDELVDLLERAAPRLTRLLGGRQPSAG